MRFLAVLIGLSVCAAVPALAQTSPPQQRPGAEKAEPRPRAATPRPSSMDDLFERLAAAKDEDEAKGIASLIERRWGRSGSDTADLLMSRAGEAAKAKDYALAIELLDRVLALEPNWAEAWHRRANVFHMMDDTVSAMADLRQALTREPRHFEAWVGLGHIFRTSEDKRNALEAYRRALKLHPQQPRIQSLIDRLKPDVEGQDL
jgi:Tfp pilus assembly protein PilF